jgi:type II secretory pathway pseudopilin PulG
MKGNRRGSRAGFTLVDLLVLAGVGGLLVPIVAPVMRDAGEQARIDQCLSNLQSVMQGALAYLDNYDSGFPLTAPSGSALCTWSLGGKSNSDYWKTIYGGYFYIRAADRALNRYVLEAEVQPDLMDGQQVVARTPMPRFQCPSDRWSHQRSFGTSLPPQPISCYDDVGTSYQYNIHVFSPDGCALLWNGEPHNPWFPNGSWDDLCTVLTRQVRARHAASFTMFLEDPMDWGLNQHTLEIGNHGELGKHSSGYLDGHADYAYRDSRSWCGVGWEAINPEWVQRVGGSIPHPVAYEELFVNCNPPQNREVGE